MLHLFDPTHAGLSESVKMAGWREWHQTCDGVKWPGKQVYAVQNACTDHRQWEIPNGTRLPAWSVAPALGGEQDFGEQLSRLQSQQASMITFGSLFDWGLHSDRFNSVTAEHVSKDLLYRKELWAQVCGIARAIHPHASVHVRAGEKGHTSAFHVDEVLASQTTTLEGMLRDKLQRFKEQDLPMDGACERGSLEKVRSPAACRL